MMRLVLDEQAFCDLVAGRAARLMTTTAMPIEIVLEDIGWARMMMAIDDAMAAEPLAAKQEISR